MNLRLVLLKILREQLFLTLSFPMFLFDPPKNIRKGDQKETLGRKGLNIGITLVFSEFKINARTTFSHFLLMK